MGQTRRRYPVRELALRVFSSAPLASGHERALMGDVIECRPPGVGLGWMEMSRFLWLRVEGLEENDAGMLHQPREGWEKRRYQIPLARLAAIVPGFNVARATDLADIYQPFLPVDEETGRFLEGVAVPPLPVEGLIFDVVTGRFL